MILILCKIPPVSSVEDLRQFVLKNTKCLNPFKKTVEISNCEILEILDQATGEREFHGLVNIPQFQQAQEAIARLNGRKLLGRPVTVREYVYRSPGDRRINARCQGLNRPEDRRRTQVKQVKHADALVVDAYRQLSENQ
jgi:hypothetical protein